jgi:hypothetical protein
MTISICSSRSRRSASVVDSLIGSATPSNPASVPSMATNITVWPWRRWLSAASAVAATRAPTSSMRRALPIATRRPSTVATTPRPVVDWKLLASVSTTPRSSAPRTMAAATGCSLPRSALAASRSRSVSLQPSLGVTATSRGFPSVSVPVLSTTSVLTRSSVSSASASRTSTPARAPRPTATITDIGVASPSAQGQAMISTATAFTSA